MKIRLVLVCVALLCLSACSGTRNNGGVFYTHAESFRVLGVSIPEDDQAKALELVPAGGKISSINSTPADWTSFLGVLGNILWIHQTEVVGYR